MKLFAAFTLSLVSYAQGLFPMPGNPPAAGGGAATFTHIQGGVGSTVSSGTTFSVTLGAAITDGNAAACVATVYPQNLTLTVQDNNAKAYTASAHSPEGTQIGATAVWLFTLLNASGAGATITATASGTILFASNIRCEEFHRSTGTWSVDTDAAGNNVGAGATINLPSITPGAAGYLLYAGTALAGSATISSTNSPWTQDAGGISSNTVGAYILSASSGATTVNWTMSPTNQAWNAMAISLK